MRDQLILFPVVAQILLTAALYFLLAVRKGRAVRAGRVNEARRALFEDAWPEDVIAVNNCIRNQFEVPVLFYVLCVLLFLLHAVDRFSLTAAGLFVLSRVVHAFVHVGPNVVPIRRRIYMFGCALVLVLTVMVCRALLGLY